MHTQKKRTKSVRYFPAGVQSVLEFLATFSVKIFAIHKVNE